ncbi:MAG: DUF2332 family protein [Dongiaceae bacterium]
MLFVIGGIVFFFIARSNTADLLASLELHVDEIVTPTGLPCRPPTYASSFSGRNGGRLGSPFTAALCTALAELLPALGTPLAGAVLGWPGRPMADALPLRLAGGLHHLALSDADPAAVALYREQPTDPDRLAAALPPLLRRWDGRLAAWLEGPPQTNEVARSALLLPALLLLARRTGLPLALWELGASAGLNLQPDAYGYRYGEAGWGDPGAPVRLAPALRGAAPELGGRLVVAARRGCDRAPVDLASETARLRLLAYIWADQRERLERCRAAIGLALASGIAVERADAADFVAAALAEPAPGCVTVIFHTVVWPYLPLATRERIQGLLAEAGARRTAEAPLAWLRVEPKADAGPRIELSSWPGRRDEMLGEADYHGRWLDWRG